MLFCKYVFCFPCLHYHLPLYTYVRLKGIDVLGSRSSTEPVKFSKRVHFSVYPIKIKCFCTLLTCQNLDKFSLSQKLAIQPFDSKSLRSPFMMVKSSIPETSTPSKVITSFIDGPLFLGLYYKYRTLSCLGLQI